MIFFQATLPWVQKIINTSYFDKKDATYWQERTDLFKKLLNTAFVDGQSLFLHLENHHSLQEYSALLQKPSFWSELNFWQQQNLMYSHVQTQRYLKLGAEDIPSFIEHFEFLCTNCPKETQEFWRKQYEGSMRKIEKLAQKNLALDPDSKTQSAWQKVLLLTQIPSIETHSLDPHPTKTPSIRL